MKRTYWIHLGYLLIVLTLFFMYRASRKDYLEQRQASYSFRSQLRDSEDELGRLRMVLQQVTTQSGFSQRPVFMDRRKYYRLNWSHFIYARLASYRSGLFGGIHDARIQLHNGTEFSLDQAVLELKYLLADGSAYQTLRIPVANLPAGSDISVPAPDSRRGVRLRLQLVSLTSQAMNFCWDRSRSASRTGPDPDRCVAGS